MSAKSPSEPPVLYLFGLGLTLIGAITYSTKAIFVKLALAYGVTPIEILTLRMIFAAPVFLMIFLVLAWKCRSLEKLILIDHVKLVITGLLGFYLASILDFAGLQYLSASLERIIMFSYPTIAVCLSILFLGQRVNKAQIFALFLTYSGLILTVLSEISSNQKDLITGGLLVFSSAICFALYMISSGQLVKKIGASFFTSYVMLIATVAVLLHSFITTSYRYNTFPHQVYALCASMAVVSTIIPTLLISFGIRHIGSSSAAITHTVGPVATIAMAAIFLGEKIHLLQVVGGCIVIAGVILLSTVKKKVGTVTEIESI